MRGTLFFSVMKTRLISSFVADKIVFNNTDSRIVVTKEENIVSNKVIAPCNHKEADTYMFLHSKHAALDSIKSVNIVSYDTDVLVTFGKGKDLQWMSIHSIVRSLCPRS